MRTAVPTRQVYPLFISWRSCGAFQEEIVLLSVFQNIRTNAKEFIKTQQTLFPTVMLDKCTDQLVVRTQADYTKGPRKVEKSIPKRKAENSQIN